MIATALLTLALLLAAAGALFLRMFRMPLRSFRGAAPPLTAGQRSAAQRLEADVRALAASPRSLFGGGNLDPAAGFLAERLGGTIDGHGNVCAEVRGTGPEIVVIGAHYDSVDGSPGADDNASGLAALIELKRRFDLQTPNRSLRFIAFVHEEPPFFRTDRMGSWLYARDCRVRGDRIASMLCLEALGYYCDSQSYPAGLGFLFPHRGDFIAFVGNLASHRLVHRCMRAFRGAATIPSEGAAVPELIDVAGWSDHWSFWRIGVPAVMVTDTALFRNPNYHTPDDLPETLDYEQLTRVVDGLEAVVREEGGASS